MRSHCRVVRTCARNSSTVRTCAASRFGIQICPRADGNVPRHRKRVPRPGKLSLGGGRVLPDPVRPRALGTRNQHISPDVCMSWHVDWGSGDRAGGRPTPWQSEGPPPAPHGKKIHVSSTASRWLRVFRRLNGAPCSQRARGRRSHRVRNGPGAPRYNQCRLLSSALLSPLSSLFTYLLSSLLYSLLLFILLSFLPQLMYHPG